MYMGYAVDPKGRLMLPMGTTRTGSPRVVSELIDQTSWSWNMQAVRDFFSPLDWELIESIRLSTSPQDEYWAWHYEKSGIFTVRSAYQLAVQLRDRENSSCCSSNSNPSGNRSLWNSIWKLNVPQKIKVFLWRVVNHGLATRLNKWKCSLEKDNLCELCGLQVESEFHALVMCDHARNLRSAMRKFWALPSEELLS